MFRIDANKQKLNWEKLTNGTYRAFMTLGVAGLPLEYQDFQGNKYSEIIEDDELFNEDSLKSAYGLPICLNHPKYGTYNNNSEGILIGHTLESFLRQDSALLMPVVVDDHRGIALIDQMISKGEYAEVSPGYWVGQRIQKDSKDNVFYQKNRTYDHLALLASGEGRGGQKLILRTDSNISLSTSVNALLETYADTYENAKVTTGILPGGSFRAKVTTGENPRGELCDYETVTTKINTMRKVTFQGKDFEVEEPLAIALDSANLQLDSLPKITKERDNLSGQLEATKIQLDSKKEFITLDAASEFVKQSIELWQIVEPVFKADSKDFVADYSLQPVQIKEVYIKNFHPNINLDGKSQDVIEGIWLVLADTIQNKLNNDSVDKVKNQLQLLTANEIINDAKARADEKDPILEARSEQNNRILNNNKTS